MSTPTNASPNVDNLQVGKGVVSFKKTGDDVFRDLGNVSELTITPEVDTLEHFSSRQGTKKKDLVIVLQQKCSAKLTMEEFTADNLALMVYGNVDLVAIGGPTVEIFANSSITGQLRFVGTNDVGPKITVDLYNVSFTPTGDLGMISDEFNSMEVTADVLAATATPGVKATGLLTVTGNPANADTVTIGANTYTFDSVLAATPNHVKIGANAQATLLSLLKAINLSGVAGTDYGAGTVIHPTVKALASDATTLSLIAKVAGSAGNAIATTEAGTNTSFGAATLLGGLDTNPFNGKFGLAQFTNVV